MKCTTSPGVGWSGLTLLVAFAAPLVGCAEAQEPARAPTYAHEPHQRQVIVLDEESIGTSSTPPVRRAPPELDDRDPTSIRLFHDVLAPYGTWTDDPRLGLVWIPSRDGVGDVFVPYGTHGRWTFREVATPMSVTPAQEYTWVSDLPWGWVTFHYGRWAYTADRGWAWIAGRRYAGAWVDWRSPSPAHTGADKAIVGWGPTPPSHVWQISPGAYSRSHVFEVDPREARVVAVSFGAFATPYTYAHARDLFAPDLGSKLLSANAALSVAYKTEPSLAPNPTQLGFAPSEVPAPPMMDRGLQQAWMLATPATAAAIGKGPELGPPPRLRPWVAGGPRYSTIIH